MGWLVESVYVAGGDGDVVGRDDLQFYKPLPRPGLFACVTSCCPIVTP